MKKQVLVFGAAGFIGTYLIEELIRRGYDVIASDLSRMGEKYYRKLGVPYIRVDITRKEQFRKIRGKFNEVIHLAALQPANYSQQAFGPADYIRVNVLGTANILDFAAERKAHRVIYASSHRNTSGLWKRKNTIRESDGRGLQYQGEYAMFSISETAAQDAVMYYDRNVLVRGVIFRLPPVYGYGPHLEIFKEGKPVKTGFQTFIENAKAGKPLEVWGDVKVGRDIIYVKDVVAAFVKTLQRPKVSGLFNISTGYRLTLKEETETIARTFWPKGSEPVLKKRPEKKHTMDSFVYSNARARKILGWRPEYNFRDLLLDYDKEVKRNKFGFLLEKRKAQFRSGGRS